MANCSSTLFMLLLLVLASGSLVLASKYPILDDPLCLTYLGSCGNKDCDDLYMLSFMQLLP
ncbi:hypothetical protein H5410_025072 [Solanum commersonii]|uniref:Uncharacterized protein n=1 Tax=Solanum commersonii TaxID=4109 RepID=A0A9J5YWW7_SOLCO|nr:hypothetical protein H5410_025072 [Solanum commersonii]